MTSKKGAVAQSFSRAAVSYDHAVRVQKEVGRALLSLLLRHKVQARQAVDIGCGTGWLTQQLAPYVDTITALDIAPGMLAFARAEDQDNVIDQFICADVEQLPLNQPDFDLVFSSYALQWCDDLSAALNKLAQILQPQGYLVFALPVQNTLSELKHSWQQADPHHAHVNEFADPALLRQQLLESGFRIKHFEQRVDTTFYATVRDLTSELKASGAHRVTHNSNPSLTGKTTVANMIDAYEGYRNSEGLLPASWHSLLVCAQKQ